MKTKKGNLDTKASLDAIELLFARLYDTRKNIVVPRVAWGFFDTHEADLIILNKSGYITEIEIKRSWSDFLADFKKRTNHDENKVMWKYFAVPDSIREKVTDYMKENGIRDWGVYFYNDCASCIVQPTIYPNNYHAHNEQKKLFLEEQLKVARLGTMKIWNLKEKLLDRDYRIKYLENELKENEDALKATNVITEK